MKESNTQKIRNLFFRLLQDGKSHTTKEIYDLVMESADIHIMNSNTVYSTLHNIRESSYSNYFIRNNDGSYRLKQYLLYPESIMILHQLTNDEKLYMVNTIKYDEAIQRMMSLCSQISSELKHLECKAKYKRIIQLNNEIYKIINEYINKI